MKTKKTYIAHTAIGTVKRSTKRSYIAACITVFGYGRITVEFTSSKTKQPEAAGNYTKCYPGTKLAYTYTILYSERVDSIEVDAKSEESKNAMTLADVKKIKTEEAMALVKAAKAKAEADAAPAKTSPKGEMSAEEAAAWMKRDRAARKEIAERPTRIAELEKQLAEMTERAEKAEAEAKALRIKVTALENQRGLDMTKEQTVDRLLALRKERRSADYGAMRDRAIEAEDALSRMTARAEKAEANGVEMMVEKNAYRAKFEGAERRMKEQKARAEKAEADLAIAARCWEKVKTARDEQKARVVELEAQLKRVKASREIIRGWHRSVTRQRNLLEIRCEKLEAERELAAK